MNSIGFKEPDVIYIPISGLEGDNLIEPCTNPKLTSWWKGECLIDLLDKLNVPRKVITKPQRATVMDYVPRTQGVLIGDCVQVKVEAGIITEKDELLLMPQNVISGIKGIEIKGIRCDQVAAGTICDLGLKLPNDFDVNYLKKGTVLCDPAYPIPLIRKFVAMVVIYDLPQQALTKGENVIVHGYTSKSAGKIVSLLSTVDQSKGTIIKSHPKFLRAG